MSLHELLGRPFTTNLVHFHVHDKVHMQRFLIQRLLLQVKGFSPHAHLLRLAILYLCFLPRLCFRLFLARARDLDPFLRQGRSDCICHGRLLVSL